MSRSYLPSLRPLLSSAFLGGLCLAALPTAAADSGPVMTLDECVEAALANNHERPASQFAVAMAEARHQQAMAGYWPQVKLSAGYERLDENPNYIFPASQMYIPPQTVQVPAGTALINVPAGVFGPNPVQLPVSTPAQTITTDGSLFGVPEQEISLMDRDYLAASVDLTWLVYDGGMRRGYREQAGAYRDIMLQEARRTDLQIVDSVKRLYYGAVLARRLHEIGNDTLARMEATLSLTESLYQEGSGTVKKTDFLDNKIMVETIRGLVAQLEKNEAMAGAALAFTMGRSWRDSVTPADKELPWLPITPDLNNLVSAAYEFSPDWSRLEAALRAAEGGVRTARSGYHPKVALTGRLHRFWNDQTVGLASDNNKKGWGVGVGLEVPLFDGFLTRGRVAEARAQLGQLKEQKFLLQEGIGLRVRDIVLSITAAEKARESSRVAMESATENRDLNVRAYQAELVETDKVIRAQLTEAIMIAQHYKALYDHIALQSQLQFVVGSELSSRFQALR
ncbi:TolC family protein [Actomonas aquatica]|uniref:TolC family protein n=1 Tax=Actomonas aquatica TaxID=2866162 RepID=A0ABZ1C6I7_9BACT|nr:TolC family protein [Opitutus sp. WL0086]WRQ87342.1 TolC family protein [Opitutus sp. WL0086]